MSKGFKIILDSKDTITINNIVFNKTCDAWPEQYDVYKGRKQVAYVRLRMGRLTVRVPNVSGKVVYYKNFEKEDPVKGYFNNQEERIQELTKIANILNKKE